MLSCLIVDDEPRASVLLESHIGKTPFLSLMSTFQSPIAALSFLQKEAIELIFLDIQMPELTGIEFLKILGGKSKVIITSAYTEYAMEGYEHDVVDYLLKPIAFDRFFRAVQKAVNITSIATAFVPAPTAAAVERKEDFILVKTEMKGKKIKINVPDISTLKA
uniref:Response regulator n=1 Tax=Roseihalotalea indica TaxID=2867963 RepID=A0AA49GQH3_9BACT|nr:response regulator [Tunicatimonas sp. TK19036]